MSSLQEHMERGFLDQYERYNALDEFLRTLGFDPGLVREVSVVPHTISVTLRSPLGHADVPVNLDFRPRKKALTA